MIIGKSVFDRLWRKAGEGRSVRLRQGLPGSAIITYDKGLKALMLCGDFAVEISPRPLKLDRPREPWGNYCGWVTRDRRRYSPKKGDFLIFVSDGRVEAWKIGNRNALVPHAIFEV